MALEQHAFLRKDEVPSREPWQAAIRQLGFDLQLDPRLVPFADSGFVPCEVAGKQSGFEIYYGPANELTAAYPHVKEQVEDRDHAISFRWGADMAACACVLIASAALAKAFGAVIYYPDDDLLYDSDDLIREANECLGDMQ